MVVLLVSMGGHLGLLQTIAWSSMIYRFAGESSLSEAVAKTFDGEHPCELCKLVNQTKRDEDKKSLYVMLKKPDVVLTVLVRAPLPKSLDYEAGIPPYEWSVSLADEEELLRPPRCV